MTVYDAHFRAASRLFDGTEILIRSVRPEDAPLLRAGFAGLSPRTRYLRFFAHKSELTDREAVRFASPSSREFAIGALGAPGTHVDGMGIGVARFSELEGDVHEAEAAVVVVDAFQGKGVGRRLVHLLAEAARERGLERLRFTALVENVAMAGLLQKVFGRSSIRAVPDEGPTVHWIVDLERAADRPRGERRSSPLSG